MASNEARRLHLLTMDEYLDMERESTVRHEYVGGHLHAFAGASDAHNRIALRVAARLQDAAGDGPCRVYISDMKLQVSEQAVYYPDIFVTCDPTDDDSYVKRNPCLVIEILSPSTASVDRREKLLAYRGLPELKSYIIFFQDEERALTHARDEHGAWWESEVARTGKVVFPCPELEMALEDIYSGIALAER